MLSKVLISALFLHICNAYSSPNQSSDCILVRSCPEAIRFAGNGNDKEKNKKLASSFCGVEVVDGKKLPKVYCSQFRTTDDRSAFTNESPADAIETHPNIKLLPEKCGKINGDRIIGGKIADLYEFPWMALISHRTRGDPDSRDNLKFKCGGSIINSKYILTAAHCVVGKKLAGVRIGELDINSKEDCQGVYPNIVCERHLQDIAIEEVIAHEGYQHLPVKDDIALLRLRKPIDFSFKNAAPVCLPVSQRLRNAVLGNKIATVAGWGITDNDKGRESHILLKVDVPVFTTTACRNIYNKNNNTDTTINKICAGEMNKDSCGGDSGGPLMVEDEINDVYRIVQYGIVSYGPKLCGSLFPGVYTNVSSYVKWILDNIKP